MAFQKMIAPGRYLPHCSSSLEHPSLMTQAVPYAPQPQPVSTTQFVRPPWQGKFALFAGKKQGQYSGRVNIPADVIPQLIAYLQQTPPNQRGDVELWLAGFQNVSKAGQQYIGGYISPQDPNRNHAVNLANGGLVPAGMVQQAYQGQQQAMANAQQHVYGQPAPSQQPQPTPQPQWQVPGAVDPNQPVPPF